MISCTIQVTFDKDDAVAEKSQMIIKSGFPNAEVIFFGHKRSVLKVTCGGGINLEHLEKFIAATLTSCGGKDVRV